MNFRKSLPLFSLCLLGAWSSIDPAASLARADEPRGDEGRIDIRHVVLISVDGMHGPDLAQFIARHPRSTFA